VTGFAKNQNAVTMPLVGYVISSYPYERIEIRECPMDIVVLGWKDIVFAVLTLGISPLDPLPRDGTEQFQTCSFRKIQGERYLFQFLIASGYSVVKVRWG